MITIWGGLRKLLSWPEFIAGFNSMRDKVRAKELAGDHSPTEARIELNPPHQWHGQNYIDLSHDPKKNSTIAL